jgi:hypothetical protein
MYVHVANSVFGYWAVGLTKVHNMACILWVARPFHQKMTFVCMLSSSPHVPMLSVRGCKGVPVHSCLMDLYHCAGLPSAVCCHPSSPVMDGYRLSRLAANSLYLFRFAAQHSMCCAARCLLSAASVQGVYWCTGCVLFAGCVLSGSVCYIWSRGE